MRKEQMEMTTDEAKFLNTQIIEYLRQYSQTLEIKQDFAFNILDKYLEVIPEIQKRDIVFLGKNAKSIKPGNIRIDLKGLLIEAVTFAASVGIPDTLFEMIQLALQGCIFIFKVSEIKLGKEEAEVVYVLHEMGAYHRKIEELKVKEEISQMMKNGRIKEFNLERFEERINNLLKIHVIDMSDGKIELKEYVWGKR